MKILMIYPEYPDTFWGFKNALKYVNKKASSPPLGLLTVAAMLPKEWEKRVIDRNITKIKDSDFEWCDAVFISAMIAQNDDTVKVIAECKSHNKTIVAGGPIFSTNYKDFKDVDHFVLRESEPIIDEFIADFTAGKAKHIYETSIKPDIALNPPPIPMWSLVNLNDYATMIVQHSRGCPFNCEFCDIIVMYGRKMRVKKPSRFIQELQAIYDAGWREAVFIVDDNFIGNKAQTKLSLNEMIIWQKENNYPFTLITEASINLAADKELMDLMSKANFNKVFLGIESPNPESLAECGKVQNEHIDVVKAVQTIQQHGMQVLGGFIVGLDSDDENIFDEMFDFIQKLGVVVAMTGIMQALPLTRLWDRLEKEGRIVTNSTGVNGSALNFIPIMDEKVLIDGYAKMMKKVFSYKYSYKRIENFLKYYKPTSKKKLIMLDVKAFFKSIWKIGILSTARFYYWKLLFSTIFTKPKSFSMMVELTIYCEHFKITSDSL